MTLPQFHNRLRSLHCIEPHDVGGLTDAQARDFITNPPRFLMRCDDATAERIWRAIEARQRP
jgi:hypothetical protein